MKFWVLIQYIHTGVKEIVQLEYGQNVDFFILKGNPFNFKDFVISFLTIQ